MINIQITTLLFIFQSFPIALFNYFIMFFFKYLLAVSIKLCIQVLFLFFVLTIIINYTYSYYITFLAHMLTNKQLNIDFSSSASVNQSVSQYYAVGSMA